MNWGQERLKKLPEEQRHLTQKREVAKFAKQARQFFFEVFCASATLRETLHFSHLPDPKVSGNHVSSIADLCRKADIGRQFGYLE